MSKAVKDNVIKPLLARIGTTVAAILVATFGIDADLSHQIVTGVLALGLVAGDLVQDWINRKAGA